MAEDQKPKLPWVKLHLERQSENSSMPPFVIGRLYQETATAYVLTNLIEASEDEETFEIKLEPRQDMDFISRTYVWRCELLTYNPMIDIENNRDMGGEGLG